MNVAARAAITRRASLALLLRGLAVASLVALSGCGFALRQTPQFAFHSLYVNAPFNSPFAVELRRYLRASNVQVYSDANDQKLAEATLDVIGEQRIRTVIAMDATGQAREISLRLLLRFRLRGAQGQELLPETELMQQRTMSYDPAFALSKESEELINYRDMESDMVQLILRRMAAVKPV